MPSTEMPKVAEHVDCSRIAQDLQIRKVQVESVVQLLDEGNTVPFITRYRKERTGGLNEEVIRQVQARVKQMRDLAERKQTILRSIEGQGKLTDELRAAILAADNPKRLEDLYLPYKPKKKTLASEARDKGLEPLALAVWGRDLAVTNLAEVLPTLVNPEKGLNTPEEVLQGVQYILAEMIAETADVRAAVRAVLWDGGKLCTAKHEKLPENQGLDYKDYFQFTEPVRHIPPHRTLAINRGEKENALQARLEFDAERVRQDALTALDNRLAALAEQAPASGAEAGTGGSEPGGPVAEGSKPRQGLAEHPHFEFLKTVTADALARLLLPSLEREIRRELTGKAEQHAVSVFARNLRSLLLAPPLRGARVLAIDPGFRTGCKLAVLDEIGNLLEDAVIFPHPPQNKKNDARAKLEELVRKHQARVVAVGNGTACRETEELVSDLIALLEKRRAGEPVEGDAPPAPAPAADESPAPAAESPAPEVPVPAPAEVSPPAQLETVAPTVTVEGAPPTADTPQPAAEGGQAAVEGTPPAAESRPPLADLPAPPADVAYIIVNEAGASVYSASAVGREEFPDYDATLRGTISIGRRLQDPLSELVKIDPQNVGVGLYQHDVNPKHLKESLEGVIESCVNTVGVDLNTASVPLLRHVSGLNQLVARELVEFRKQHGPFRDREQLMQVPGVGPARYVQAAGFLKVLDGGDPLDRTWIHPESYPVARQLLGELGYEPQVLHDREKLDELREKLKAVPLEETANRLQVGIPTLRDMLDALARPGRDPREDLPPPIFKKGILKLEDLQPGMELKGTVLNVVDFGAFIDIGLKDSGLVHISRMANRYIKNPYEVVAVGDVVTVWVVEVDQGRRRVSLTMIQPGTERKPPERGAAPPRREQGERGGERGGRPPRGRGRPAHAGGRGPHGRPPHGAKQPAPATASAEGTPPAAAAPAARPAGGAPRPPQPLQRPRKPQRQAPRPKLTQSALKGETPLHTFSELSVFWESRGAEEKPAAPPQAQGPEEAPPPT